MSSTKKLIIYIISIVILTGVLCFLAGRSVEINKIEEDVILSDSIEDELDQVVEENKKLKMENEYWKALIDQYANWLYECEEDLRKLIEIDDDLFLKILGCENIEADPDLCNQRFGCGSGIGIGQLTDIAIRDCENCVNGLCRDIDPFDPADNLECSLWLYETYGTAPWGCEDCEWGSWECWSSKVVN